MVMGAVGREGAGRRLGLGAGCGGRGMLLSSAFQNCFFFESFSLL